MKTGNCYGAKHNLTCFRDGEIFFLGHYLPFDWKQNYEFVSRKSKYANSF